jgi:hypothetical protein
MIAFLSDGGKGHPELKAELEKPKGVTVWLGGELKTPGGNYWAENTMTNEMVIVKPDSVDVGAAA